MNDEATPVLDIGLLELADSVLGCVDYRKNFWLGILPFMRVVRLLQVVMRGVHGLDLRHDQRAQARLIHPATDEFSRRGRGQRVGVERRAYWVIDVHGRATRSIHFAFRPNPSSRLVSVAARSKLVSAASGAAERI